MVEDGEATLQYNRNVKRRRKNACDCHQAKLAHLQPHLDGVSALARWRGGRSRLLALVTGQLNARVSGKSNNTIGLYRVDDF